MGSPAHPARRRAPCGLKTSMGPAERRDRLSGPYRSPADSPLRIGEVVASACASCEPKVLAGTIEACPIGSPEMQGEPVWVVDLFTAGRARRCGLRLR